jgi:hypothetical protein
VEHPEPAPVKIKIIRSISALVRREIYTHAWR